MQTPAFWYAALLLTLTSTTSALGSSFGADLYGQAEAATALGFSVQMGQLNTLPDLGFLGVLTANLPLLDATASSSQPLINAPTLTATAHSFVMGSVLPHSLHVFAQGQTTRSLDGILNANVEADLTAAWEDVITVAGPAPVGTPVTLMFTAHFNSSLVQSGVSPNQFPFTDAVVAFASVSDASSPLLSPVGIAFNNDVTCLPLISPCSYSSQSLPGSQVQTATLTARIGDQLDLDMQDAVGIKYEQQADCVSSPLNCGIPGFTQIQANGLNSFDLNIDVLTPGAFLVAESGASYASTSTATPEPPTFVLSIAGLVATCLASRHTRRTISLRNN